MEREKFVISKGNNKKDFYKKWVDDLDSQQNETIDTTFGRTGLGTRRKLMQMNYNLYNNIINEEDYNLKCNPNGEKILPIKGMTNRDIISSKINTLMGMEARRPHSTSLFAVNSEATTRKEQEEFGKVLDYVKQMIMIPIRQAITAQETQQLKGRKPTPEELQKVQEDIEKKVEQNTPPRIRKYMSRKYQDPAEMQANQLINYLMKSMKIEKKLQKAYKHGLIAGIQVGFMGILNNQMVHWTLNPKRFNCDSFINVESIEKREWATYEYQFTPSEIAKYFGDNLTKKQINDIYEYSYGPTTTERDLFTHLDEEFLDNKQGTINILHCTKRFIRTLGFLDYYGLDGQPKSKIVDENYEFNPELGDISIEWVHDVPEVHEAWKIRLPEPLYVNTRPIPGQFKDLNNLYESPLPYKGVMYDNDNAESVSVVGRLAKFQYDLNVVMRKVDKLIESDKGKKLLMNIGLVPTSKGVSLKQWQTFFEETPFAWYNPKEEGTDYNDANSAAKVLDMSLISQIQQYIGYATFITKMAGSTIGVTDYVMGETSPRDAVGNVQQNLQQSSYVLDTYSRFQDSYRESIIMGLLELAKVYYHGKNSVKLSYIADDETMAMYTVDMGLIDSTTYGLFLADSNKISEIKGTIKEFIGAEYKAGKMDINDITRLLRQESIIQMEEILESATEKAQEQQQAQEEQKQQAMMKQLAEEKTQAEQNHKWKMEEDTNKETERRKTEIIKASLLGMSFNPDMDEDKNGVNDFWQIAQQQFDNTLKLKNHDLNREKFNQKKETDNQNIELKKKQLAKANSN